MAQFGYLQAGSPGFYRLFRREIFICRNLKCLLDTFTHAGLYNDDSQICKLTVIKREPMPPDGMAYIRISEWKNEDRTADDAGKSSRNS